MLRRLFPKRPRPTPSPTAHSHGAPAVRPSWPLDEPFFRLTPWDCLTTRDMFEGVLALGNPGSGKTSTTGLGIAMSALHGQWGIVAYCAKPDDATVWERLCHRTGRSRDLINVRPDGRTHFNLMRYEMERPGGGNTLRLAAQMTEAFREGKPRTAPSEASEYFEELTKMLLVSALDLHRLAGEPLSFRSIGRLAESAPKEPKDLKSSEFAQGLCCELVKRAVARVRSQADHELLDIVTGYFIETLPSMNERSRGDVFATLDSSLFQLNREPIRGLLDSPRGCSFVPEMLERGAVFVIDCPESVHGSVGRSTTIALKRSFKEMMRRRHIDGDFTRPILSYADEAQCIVTRDDAEFQQICRSNRVASVLLTQSIDNLSVALGNEAHANSLANALTAHVYHCTSGHTADWIERRIAQSWRSMETVSYSGSQPEAGHKPPGLSIGQGLHPQILASELTRLATGGVPNRGLVEAIVFKPGRRFAASHAPFTRVRFQQM